VGEEISSSLYKKRCNDKGAAVKCFEIITPHDTFWRKQVVKVWRRERSKM